MRVNLFGCLRKRRNPETEPLLGEAGPSRIQNEVTSVKVLLCIKYKMN